jgi:hypothetical protein
MTQLFLEKKNYLSNIYHFCVCLLAIGLCTSKALVSISAVTLFLLSVFSFKLADLQQSIRTKKSLLFLFLFFVYYCLSIIWSSNFSIGIQDIVSKLNLVIIPIALLIKPIDSKWLDRIFTIFIWAVVSTSVYNFIHFQFFTATNRDIRALSLFVSHIRFSLFISFSLGLILRYIWMNKNFWKRILYFSLFCWLLFYMYYSEVLSGILGLVGGVVLCSLIRLLSITKTMKWGYLISFIALMLIALFVSYNLFKTPITPHRVARIYPHLTKLGNAYSHDTLSKEMENGNYIYTLICDKEIDSVWPTLSSIPLNQQNSRGYQTRMVMYRYLTSKGLPKDAYGLQQLSQEDIRSIENGIPSVLEVRSGIFSKINYYFKNLNQSENPNGNSFLQRLEYWRVGSTLFKKHPIIGVGIGDYKSAFAEEYEKKESLLSLENRLETHQQFLSVLIATGCIGGIVFALIFYFYILETSTNPLAIYFIGIILASFLVEDTLTTLAGMSFFSLFYTLFQTSIPPLSGIAEKC